MNTYGEKAQQTYYPVSPTKLAITFGQCSSLNHIGNNSEAFLLDSKASPASASGQHCKHNREAEAQFHCGTRGQTKMNLIGLTKAAAKS